MKMDGIEQGLYVYLAFRISGIQVHLDAAARGHFTVEGMRILFVAVVESEFVCDFRDGSIQQDILAVEDYYRVDDVFQITDLMCGNEKGGILCGVFRDRFRSSMKRYLQLQARANEM